MWSITPVMEFRVSKDGKGYLLPVDVLPRSAQEDGYPIDLLYRNLGSLKEARSVGGVSGRVFFRRE